MMHRNRHIVRALAVAIIFPALFAVGWTVLGTNIFGIPYGTSTFVNPTDADVITYQASTNTYELKAGGSGGVTGINAGANITLTGPTSNPTVSLQTSPNIVTATLTGGAGIPSGSALTTSRVTANSGDALTLFPGGPNLNISLNPSGTGESVIGEPNFAFGGDTNGDIVYRIGGTYARLGIGSTSQVLTVVAGEPSWQTPSSGSTLNVTVNGGSSYYAPANLRLNGGTNVTISEGFASTTLDVTFSIPSSLPPNGSASGDLAGSYPSPTVTALHLGGSGGVRGDLAEYGSSGWANFAPGTSGYFLGAQGAGADPAWTIFAGDLSPQSTLGVIWVDNLHFGSDAAGDMPLRGSSVYGRLAIGSTGTVLQVAGGTATWATPTGTGAPVLQTSPTLNTPTFATSANVTAGGTFSADTIQAETTNGILTIQPNGSGTTVKIPATKILQVDVINPTAATGTTVGSLGLVWPNNAANPTTAGQVVRDANDLQFYNTAARNLLDDEYHPVMQILSATGTITPTANTVFAIIECAGSGGGGGGVVGTSATSIGGGGGGGGSYSRSIILSPTAQSCTIGAAGSGGAGANNGTAGGDAVYGSNIVVGKGGGGGNYGEVGTQYGTGGTGGVAGTGSLIVVGNSGGNGIFASISTIAAFSGYGGSSFFGGGGPIANGSGSSHAGINGVQYGSGGSGAASNGVSASPTGGNGSLGVILETDYVRR